MKKIATGQPPINIMRQYRLGGGGMATWLGCQTPRPPLVQVWQGEGQGRVTWLGYLSPLPRSCPVLEGGRSRVAWLGCPSPSIPPVNKWADTSENLTFPRTTCVVGKIFGRKPPAIQLRVTNETCY